MIGLPIVRLFLRHGPKLLLLSRLSNNYSGWKEGLRWKRQRLSCLRLFQCCLAGSSNAIVGLLTCRFFRYNAAMPSMFEEAFAQNRMTAAEFKMIGSCYQGKKIRALAVHRATRH
jgi:hypothetical protein